MMNSDEALTDCAFPLMNGWLAGTTNETAAVANAYNVMTRMLIFLAAIFMLSDFVRSLLSAAVAAL